MKPKSDVFSVRVITGPHLTQWVPITIFFEVDHKPKGWAFFSTRMNATNFMDAMPTNHPRVIVQLGVDIRVNDYLRQMATGVGDWHIAMKDLPIFIDPPDNYCVNWKFQHQNMLKFILDEFEDETQNESKNFFSKFKPKKEEKKTTAQFKSAI